MKNLQRDHISREFGLTIIGLAFISVGVLVLGAILTSSPGGGFLPGENSGGTESSSAYQVVKFTSADDFKEYLAEAELTLMDGGGRMNQMLPSAIEGPMMAVDSKEMSGTLSGGGADRVSVTNVQVSGIDEPDIVKVDGKNIYFSSNISSPVFMREERMLVKPGTIMPPQNEPDQKVKMIQAFPPADLKEVGSIKKYGDLLLSGDTLVILPPVSTYRYYGRSAEAAIYGFNVSDPKAPSEKWKVEIGEQSSVAAARLYNGKIYLITATGVQGDMPCPIVPLRANGMDVTIPCGEIYHPISRVPVDVTFTVSILDPQNGDVTKTASFVGYSGNSVVYMSPSALYIAYPYMGDMFGFLFGFIKEDGRDLIPSDIIARLEKIAGYELSYTTKLMEFQTIIERYQNSLDNDERRRIENELENRAQSYAKLHIRDLERTGIIKISLINLELGATGSIPGTLLNQFALDEYRGALRAATTISGRGGMLGGITESANDVYVLDGVLRIVGSVKDLGLTERIFSVRFLEDKGYVVTFRQTDPFYVLDLSDPGNPELKGELKIPGFSSYLDPIAENRVLGIGREGSSVKLSLFDVSSPANPRETAKYTLDENWSDIQNTHHAFLADKDREIFFLPAGSSGYIFSYAGDTLKLIRVVSDIQAKRAVYMSDYLYVIGDRKIVVLDEKNWERVNELPLN